MHLLMLKGCQAREIVDVVVPPIVILMMDLLSGGDSPMVRLPCRAMKQWSLGVAVIAIHLTAVPPTPPSDGGPIFSWLGLATRGGVGGAAEAIADLW